MRVYSQFPQPDFHRLDTRPYGLRTKGTKGTKERRGKRSSHAKIAKNAKRNIKQENTSKGVFVFAFFVGLSERSERA